MTPSWYPDPFVYLRRQAGISLALTQNTGGGVARYRVFDGILYELLLGADSEPLQGADGYYLYGVA